MNSRFVRAFAVYCQLDDTDVNTSYDFVLQIEFVEEHNDAID